ncbi:TonB-dependent receptor plug domain-containing protein [Abyssalbus ytuae]|uniref:TonB-dependent receptor n=1 Tax=Abyssalbus ytuae TaxID=2926907 RepID=A0A9E7CU08_9FLAO|nr:TonB-dependent receptor [Abyssalbus ytuae]UOB19151.1 TonB-dependent receptor [Abyssalbus ytuae]
MKLYFFFFFIFFSCLLKAQTITVQDKETGTPVKNVTAYNSDKSVYEISDEHGKIDISSFKNHEIIVFRHLTFITKRLIKSQILRNNLIVVLEPTSEELEEIVLSATKWKQKPKEVYQKVSSIVKEDVILANPQTSADMLQQTGQIFVQKSQLGGGSPMIRGFSTNRLLISVDGIRMNNAIFRGGNIQNVISIDPLAVDKTEILFGPGALIYGSDAIGGVMNFYTESPAFSADNLLEFNGRSIVRYSTANNEKTANLQFRVARQKWASLTNITYSGFGDLKMGKYGPDEYLRREFVKTGNGEDIIVKNNDPRVQKPTGYNQINFLQKIKYKPGEAWNYTAGLYYSTTSNYSRYDRLVRYRGDNLRSAEWYYGPQKWFMGNLQVANQSKNIFFDKVKFTNAYQFFEESRNDRNFNDDYLFTTKEKVRAFSSNIDLEKNISRRFKVFYGIEYVYNHVNSKGKQINIQTHLEEKTASRYPDGSSWQSLAAYINVENKPSNKLTFTSGVRYNHFFIDADFKENNEFYHFPFNKARVRTGALTGSTGVNWQPNNVLQWRFNLSTAFRAPNIDDIGKIFDSEPGKVVVPNPSLKPEYAYNGEAGVKFNFNDKVILDFATYYTHLTNSLVRRPFSFNGMNEIMYNGELSEVQSIQNAAQARVHGFEGNAKVNISRNLSLKSSLSYVNGKEELDSGEETPVRHASPMFGSTHLIWDNSKVTFDFFADYNGELSFYQLAPSEREKDYIYATDENGNPYSPAWYTLNLRSKYTFSHKLELTAAIENITNQRYRPYSSGIVAPGTNIITSLIYNF